jgi:protease-4
VLAWIFLFFLLFCSLGLNAILILAWGAGSDDSSEGPVIREHYHSGHVSATDKIAVVTIEGVLLEGLTGYARKQIERAAQDTTVKAVVLRINSPGGSITASDDLHHLLTELRDGNATKNTSGKPLVVSMASLAASGGYYIAMPAKTLVAERTTITGSIGVYAALPNATELGKKIGFRMNVIKAGEVKDSGSPFHEMTPKERDLWQAMVDHSYLQFLQVVEQGRPQLKGKLQEDIVFDETVPVRDDKGLQKRVQYKRYRADGGIFMADEAQKYGLIDQIGYLDDAIQAAKQTAGLGDNYKVVTYEKVPTLLGALLGVKSQPPALGLDPSRFAAAAMPRLWYLSPQSELAGLLAVAGQR